MLRAAITFFVIGLLAVFLGANNIGGLSIELGRLLLGVFLILAVISLLTGIATGRKPRIPMVLLALGMAGLGMPHPVSADETLGEKAETARDSVKKDTRKTVRKAKKHHRDSRGQKNVMKDAGDAAENAGDEAEYQTQKALRKAD